MSKAIIVTIIVFITMSIFVPTVRIYPSESPLTCSVEGMVPPGYVDSCSTINSSLVSFLIAYKPSEAMRYILSPILINSLLALISGGIIYLIVRIKNVKS